MGGTHGEPNTHKATIKSLKQKEKSQEMKETRESYTTLQVAITTKRRTLKKSLK